MSEEQLEFQAEVSRLLDIVAGALYSNREVFLRELISNAADACDRLRYAALTQPELLAGDSDFQVVLKADPEAGTLTVEDNGIGMNREELIENLGTIAHSGSAAFMASLEGAETDEPTAKNGEGAVDLIGQFGVGFYSAFMVADEVRVESRLAGETAGWVWRSEGRGKFTLTPHEDAPARGTRITVTLKEDAKEFADPKRVEQIVRAHSDHVAVPVYLVDDDEPRQVNSASALWRRPKSEITEEQYKDFYHHVAHAFDEPWARLHFQVEGMLSYSGLLYIPSTQPFDLFHPERQTCVKLYVKRVFITEDCEQILPGWLRFVRGVVDNDDLPLNVSREMLQHSPVLAKMRQGLVKRILDHLDQKAEKAPEDYAQFWETFGAVLKEGLYEDPEQRARLLELARFRSSAREGWIGLSDYLKAMKDGQDAIYFIAGDDLETVGRSPQLEGYKAKGVEVLLLTDPIDEFWIGAVAEYEGKPFRSVTRGAADLDKIGGAEESEAAEETQDEQGLEALLAHLKLALKDEVKEVRASKRLTDSPVCLVADEGDMDMHLERLLRQHRQLDRGATRILEINPRHALIQRLAERVKGNGQTQDDTIEETARLLYDQALILEGETPADPAGFARRLASAMARGLA